MLADLHIHSRCSSGEAFGSPTEMVLAAKRRGLDAIALTDHDTCAGLPEALEAGERHGVLVIPGVELLLRYGSRRCHVLALGGIGGQVFLLGQVREEYLDRGDPTVNGARLHGAPVHLPRLQAVNEVAQQLECHLTREQWISMPIDEVAEVGKVGTVEIHRVR